MNISAFAAALPIFSGGDQGGEIFLCSIFFTGWSLREKFPE